MSKKIIILLAFGMTITFFGIFSVQFNYFRTLVGVRQHQFDEAVKGSLYQTSRILEEQETINYLNQAISKVNEDPLKEDNCKSYLDFEVDFFHLDKEEDIRNLSSKGSSVREISKNTQKKMRMNFVRKRIVLNDMAMRWFKTAIPIEERIDMEYVHIILAKELEHNRIYTDFQTVLMNYKGEKVFVSPGFNPEEMGNDYYSQIFFPNDYNPQMNLIRVYFPNKETYIWESMYKLLISSCILTILLFITFATSLLLIFRQRRLAASKTDFMNNMTHEFKTPISSISLASQMLQDDSISKNPAVLKNISRVIRDETKRLSFQVEKVLQISLLENEKSIMKFKEADANEMIQSVVDNFELKVKSGGGVLKARLFAKDSIIMLDELHFANIIFNLLDNAVKYAKEDEELLLQVNTWNDEKNEQLYISVQDNGVGIKREHLKRIFDKFHRVPTGNVHNVKGFGLGLAYVKKMVQKHNGQIQAESDYKVGTRFIIIIPTLKK